MTTPMEYYAAVAVGLLCYLLKKWVAGEGWHVGAFLKRELGGIVNSIWVTVGIAYLVPDLVLYASDMPKLDGIAEKYPMLISRVTVVMGGALGFTGGSIALDLLPMLYNLPVVGPALQKLGDYFKSRKADKMAAARGIEPKP